MQKIWLVVNPKGNCLFTALLLLYLTLGNIKKEKIAVGKQRKNISIFFSENGVLKEKTKKLLGLNNRTKKKEGFGTFAIGQDFDKDHFWSRKVREREKHYADF